MTLRIDEGILKDGDATLVFPKDGAFHSAAVLYGLYEDPTGGAQFIPVKVDKDGYLLVKTA